MFLGPGVGEAILKERGFKGRTGLQPRCTKLSAKVQTANGQSSHLEVKDCGPTAFLTGLLGKTQERDLMTRNSLI